jgi:hypothetical protein
MEMIAFWRRDELGKIRGSKYVLALDALATSPPNQALQLL